MSHFLTESQKDQIIKLTSGHNARMPETFEAISSRRMSYRGLAIAMLLANVPFNFYQMF